MIDPDGMRSTNSIQKMWDDTAEGTSSTWTNNGDGGFSDGGEEDKGKKANNQSVAKDENVNGFYNYQLYLNKDKNKLTFAGYSVGFNRQGKYGSTQFNLTGFRGEAFDYSGSGKVNWAVEAGAKATGVQATGSMRLGTNDNNIQANAEGNALVGEANISAGYFSGENNKKGAILSAEAGVYGLKGEFNPSFSVFGYKFGYTLGGSLGSAAIGAGLGAYRDTNKGTHHINGYVIGAFVVGGKVGFQIVIP